MVKIFKLRIFEDENGKTNRSLADVNGQVLIVSQFTLYGGVQREHGQGIHADVDGFLGARLFGAALFNLLNDFIQQIPQKDGDDGRRRFMGAQAVFVAGFGDGGAQQVRVFVHGLDRGAEQGEEDGVFLRAGTRVEQAAVTGGGEGPVVVLAGAVHAGEGLFMQQADHVMLVGGLAEHFHDQHVVVHGQVLAFKDGRNFKLAGRNFIVARFGRNAKFPEGFVHVHHEFQHAVLDGAEVVVFHLLVLGGDVAEEGAAAHHQVRAQGVKLLVHQEVFLLRAQIGADVDVGRAAEAGQQAPGLAGDGGHGAEKGVFLSSACPL